MINVTVPLKIKIAKPKRCTGQVFNVRLVIIHNETMEHVTRDALLWSWMRGDDLKQACGPVQTHANCLLTGFHDSPFRSFLTQ